MKRNNLIINILVFISTIGIIGCFFIGDKATKNSVDVEVISGDLDSLKESKLIYGKHRDFGKGRNTELSKLGTQENYDVINRSNAINKKEYSEIQISLDDNFYSHIGIFNDMRMELFLNDEVLEFDIKYINSNEKKTRKLNVDINDIKKALNIKDLRVINIFEAVEHDNTLKMILEVNNDINEEFEFRVLNINLDTKKVSEDKSSENMEMYKPLHMNDKYIYAFGGVPLYGDGNGYLRTLLRYDINDISKYEILDGNKNMAIDYKRYEELDLENQMIFIDNTESFNLENKNVLIINKETNKVSSYERINIFTQEEASKYVYHQIFSFDDKIAVTYFKDKEKNLVTALSDDDIFTKIIDLKTNKVVLEIKSNTGQSYVEGVSN